MGPLFTVHDQSARNTHRQKETKSLKEKKGEKLTKRSETMEEGLTGSHFFVRPFFQR